VVASPELLRQELMQLLPGKAVLVDIGECTPRFILSRAIVHRLLTTVRATVLAAAKRAGVADALTCLSIKTQPHPIVLTEARRLGYLPGPSPPPSCARLLPAAFS